MAPQRAPTSPAGTVSQPIGKPFNGQAKGLLWLTWRSYAGPPQYYIPPEGGSPEPVREASADPGQNLWHPGPSGPAAPSTLAAKPRQPSGIQVSADSSQRPMTSNVAHSKKALTLSISAFSVNQQLPILPGRFQPSTFGVCELNYRVRHGYGCILTAIATESLRVCSLKTA